MSQPSPAAPPAPPNAPARAPARPAPKPRPDAVLGTRQPQHKVEPIHWAILAGICLIALVLRLRDPLSSNVVISDDPYTHMTKTWDLVQGQGKIQYPLGMSVLLFPFTWLGAPAFFQVARFLPPVIGTAAAGAMFLLCRRWMHPIGALAAALLVAGIPELVRRTDFLVPEDLDLLLLPLAFAILLQLPNISRKQTVGLSAIGAIFFLVHPWVLALAIPPVLIYGLLYWGSGSVRTRATVAGGILAGGVIVILALRGTVVSGDSMGNVLPKLGSLASNPGSLFPLPRYVDLPSMLTTAGLVAGAIGVVVAFRRRDRFSVFALLWTGLLLPLCLVDWFNVDFLPHRIVAYMALGLAMLGGLAVAELLRLFPDAKPRATNMLGFGALALVAILVVPSGASAANTTWYRLFGDNDMAAWDALDARGTEYVVAGSWEGKVGYRAYTGNQADFNPGFFNDPNTRALTMSQHPGMAVLIDNYTTDPQNGQRIPAQNLAFLQEPGWTVVGRWGTTIAYARA